MTSDVVIGAILLALGLVTLAARIFKWDGLISRRQAMQRKLGPVAGDLFHYTIFTILPIVVGALILNRYFEFL